MTLFVIRDYAILASLKDHRSGKSENDSLDRRDNAFTCSEHIARLYGNLTLGALLPIRTSNAELCSGLYVDGIMLVEAIIFALRDAKKRKLIPEEITLGYEIRDTCNSVRVAQRHTLDIVVEATKFERSNQKINKNINESDGSKVSNLTQVYKQSSESLIAVVGAGNSEISVAVNRLLSAFNIPQIGFASTSRYLSDKLRFPSFFRTVPSDTYQVQGLLALFEKLTWNYVGLLVSDGDYGRPLADSFRTFAKRKGMCIPYDRLVPFQVSQMNAKSIVRDLSAKTNIEVIVILLPEPDVETLLSAMLEIGLNNKTLIASDSWSKAIKDVRFSKIVEGTLGLAHYYEQIAKFEDYFLGLKPNTNTWNPWFNETWEHLFDCVLPQDNSLQRNRTLTSEKFRDFCNLKSQHLKREYFTRFHYVSNIINAVFAVANGIRRFYMKQANAEFLPTSHQLLKSLKKLTFEKYDGENITFDENGDVGGKYNLVNIYSDLTSRNVGIWNGKYLEINDLERIWWNTVERTPPKGICSLPCPAGWHRHASETDPQCCWTCQRCFAGSISNRTDATRCLPCPKDYMTDINRTACVFIPLNYLDWGSFWTISIILLALLSVCILFFVVLLFMRYFNTPVVKSSNRELSLLLGVGLFLTFLVPFVFAGRPTNLKCIISQMMFCVGCALALSAMVFRTLRIVLLFGFMTRRRWLLKNKYQIAMTLSLTFAELTYCLLWVAISPPGVKTVKIRPTKRYLVCDFNKYWYSGSHLLLIFLSVVCTILAVKGRKLPKNFNEVRHIGLSMFTFNIVWVVFMCAQYGASLEYDVKINCFAMIISSLMILVLLFGPKVFILLFRSHLNKKEEFQAEVRRYSFGVPNGNTSTSATPLRRVSSMTFRTANSSNEQFLHAALEVGSRIRSNSFDAMAGRLYQNSNRLPKRSTKETQTDFLDNLPNVSGWREDSETPPVVVRITQENGDGYLTECGERSDSTNDLELEIVETSDSNCYRDLNSTHIPECTCRLMSHDISLANRSHCGCSNELESLLRDLDVPNKHVRSDDANSFTGLLEKLSSNGGLTSSTTHSSGEDACKRMCKDDKKDVAGFQWPLESVKKRKEKRHTTNNRGHACNKETVL